MWCWKRPSQQSEHAETNEGHDSLSKYRQSFISPRENARRQAVYAHHCHKCWSLLQDSIRGRV